MTDRSSSPRNPRVASLTAGIVGLLLVLLVASLVFNVLLMRERDEKENQRQAAVAEKEKAEEAARVAADERKKADRYEQAEGGERDKVAEAEQAAARERKKADEANERARKNAAVALEQSRLAADGLFTVLNQFQGQFRGNQSLQGLRLRLLEATERDLARAIKNLEGKGIELDPVTDPVFQRTQANLSQHRGDVLLEMHRTEEALQQYEKTHAIVAKLARDREDPPLQDGLALVCIRLGRANNRLGRAAPARDYLVQARDLRLELAKVGNAPAQREAARAQGELGEFFLEHGDPVAAREQFVQAQRILAKIALKGPELTREQANHFTRLGQVHLRLGNAEESIKHHQRALQLRQELAKAPNAGYATQRDVLMSLSNLGGVNLLLRDDAKAAQEYYDQALKGRSDLASRFTVLSPAQHDLASSHYQLAVVKLRTGQKDEAQTHFQECLKLREKLAAAEPNDRDVQIDLMLARARCGRHAEAVKTAGLLQKLESPRAQYAAACGLALCSAAPEAEQAVRQGHADAARKALHQAVELGWKDAVLPRADPDLDAVREHPDFQDLLKKLPQPHAATVPSPVEK